MKKIIVLMTTFLMISAAHAETRNLDLRCVAQKMPVGKVNRLVHVWMDTDYQTEPYRFELHITVDTTITMAQHVSITSTQGAETKLATDDQVNGYNITAVGELFPSTANDPCSSSVSLTLEPIGTPGLKISGELSCTAVCDW